MEVCFVAGTQILMADGTTKPIEQIRPGDMVLAVDHNAPEHDTPKPAKVTRFFDNGLKNVVKLIFENQETGQQFEVVCTPSHRFYVKNKGWVTAGSLQRGNRCTSFNEIELVFISRDEYHNLYHVYNIEVGAKHTYYIGNKRTVSLLVHNACQWHHLLPQNFKPFFEAVGLDIHSSDFGWILDAEYHLQKSHKLPGGKTIHDSWNQEWKAKLHEYVNNPLDKNELNRLSKSRRQILKSKVLKQLETMKKDSRYSRLLASGRAANMSYSEWQRGIRQVGEAMTLAKKTGLKQTIKLLGKSAKIIGVVTVAYNLTTGGYLVAAENAGEAIAWPIPDIFRAAGSITDEIYDYHIELGRQYRSKITNIDWTNPGNIDISGLRPGGEK